LVARNQSSETNERDNVMIGCVLIAAGTVGLIRLAHLRRYGCGGPCGGGWHGGWHHHRHGHHGHGDGDHGGPFGPGAGRGRGFGRRFVLRGILDRIEASPAQERVIVAAADEFHDEVHKVRGELRKSRGEVADAFRKPTFDGVLLGELFARHDTSIEGLRKAFVGLTAKVHDALDEKQRSRLADIIESGPGFFRGGGLFRGGWGRHDHNHDHNHDSGFGDHGPARHDPERHDFDRSGGGW
jgi:hypothetical protein